MGKKVFRIHNDGSQNNDWFSSGNINPTLIDNIQTDGGNGKALPTSIPSPFARLDLVRTAFASIGASGKLDGITKNGKAVATDNHKLVSDALDIGQLLFNYNKHQEDLKLLVWNKQKSLSNLLNANSRQNHLGKTLNLFLQQDSMQYNFDQFDNIYILLYKHKVIGGTSPRTLFFAAPDAQETNIKFGQDTMLDGMLLPLYKRDAHYIKYLYCISQTIKFNQFFPEFNSYILATLNKLANSNPGLHDELRNLDATAHLKSLEGLYYNNNLGQPVDVINDLYLKQFIKNPALIEKQSDFVIDSSKKINGSRPLVLPVEQLNLPYIYTEAIWDRNTKVPYQNPFPLDDRQLPDQGDKYPYLTMNDFLTESIIKLPYEIDGEKFFNFGNKKYMLPLTPLFFEYFSVEDIVEKGLVQIKELAGSSVELTLNVPIKQGFISYVKIYNQSVNINQEKKENRGSIIEKSFALAIYPFNKSSQIEINYTIGLADIFPEKLNPLSIKIFSDLNGEINPKTTKQRSKNPYKTTQTITDKNFDSIAIGVDQVFNYIIPLWDTYKIAGGDAYTFAIDFGTTNTHIEYAIEGQGGSKAFNISQDDMQITFLMPSDAPRRAESIRMIEDGESHLMQEIIPKTINEDSLITLPFRSCLVQNSEVNYDLATFTFGDANIGFDYEKKVIRNYLKSFTNLKWDNNENNENQVKHYIEELLMLCKNKVLANNGDLARTKVIWFYPVSMTTNHLNRFRNIWARTFKEIFQISENNLSDFPESIAPFYHYRKYGNIKTSAKPSVSIDIGGGTSDVMIYYAEKPQLITSFKFAGNVIFGDGFNGNIRSNGFVSKYKDQIAPILSQNRLIEEEKIFNKIFNENQSSTDLINFIFSLKDNKNVKERHINNLDFGDILGRDDNFKIIFLLFYSAIIYHVAETMKIKNIERPRNIVFSGTGSKTMEILDPTTNLGSLTKLFEGIFDKVYGSKDSEIGIKTSKNPKEITCKGGFHIDSDLDGIRHIDLIEVNIGHSTRPMVQSKSMGNDVITYKHLTPDYLKGIIENVNKFYEIFNQLANELEFKNEFNVSHKSFEIFNKIKGKDQLDYIMQGIKSLTEDSIQEEPVAQSLFFFPLIGLLYELASDISQS